MHVICSVCISFKLKHLIYYFQFILLHNVVTLYYADFFNPYLEFNYILSDST